MLIVLAQLPVVPHVYEQLKHLLISAGTGSKHGAFFSSLTPFHNRR